MRWERSSSNYKLTGELAPVLGSATSTNYKVDVGFPATTGGTISLSLDNANVSLGSITPGTPATGTTTVTVTTNAINGYALAIQKNRLLTHTVGDTIADVSGSISLPDVWSGTGFGFTVTSGTSLEAKWGSGSNFAAIPTQLSTAAHTVVQALTAPDNTIFTYKVNVSATQRPGSYSTIVDYIATARP